MRPRVFPAEDICRKCAILRPCRFNEAAGIPAEDPCRSVPNHPTSDCFNEAAGIPRGRRWRGSATSRSACCRFNEAAGIPRGRLRLSGTRRRRSHGFNEAAGIPRGRRQAELLAAAVSRASMRPRVFPAEDGARDTGRGMGHGASMRPRVFPAEDPKNTPPAPASDHPLQ